MRNAIRQSRTAKTMPRVIPMLSLSVDVLTDAAEDVEDAEGSEDSEDVDDGACVGDGVVARCVAVAAELVVVAWLLVGMLYPLTGTAKTVAAEVNTVVEERLVPETTPVSHDSVWPSVSIDVH